MSSGEILSSILQFLIVGAIAFAILCLVTSWMRFHNMAAEAESASPTDRGGADAFRMRVAALLGSAHREPEPFQLVFIRLVLGDGLPHADDPDRLEEAVTFVTDRIYRGIRKEDTLLRLDDRTLGSLIAGPCAVGREVAERIARQFAGQRCRFSDGAASPVPVQIAISAHPEDGERVEALMQAGLDALPASPEPSEDSALFPSRGFVPGADDRPRPTPADPLAALPPSQHKLVDPVTGVLKEEHLGSVFQKQVAQCRKDGKPVSILAIQIDHLDRYLDHYGPGGIESIYRHVGCYLQGAVREIDLLGRLGEDKIVVLMYCPPTSGLLAAQRIADGIRRLEIDCSGTQLKVTASMGIAGYPDHGGLPRKLMDFSIIALEVAKTKGRDLCLLYEPGMEIPKRVTRERPAF